MADKAALRFEKGAALLRNFFIAAAGFVILPGLQATAVHAQQPVILDNSFRHQLHSRINGVDYQLTVVLPPNYEKTPDKRYPTFFVMDGNRWAPFLAVILPRFVANAGYPPIIVVGVDYPGATGRYQDYGPVSQRYFPVPENRGAANFMRVMKDEIIPFIDRSYPTDPRDRGIGGHSMGGFLAAYALLHSNDMFHRFWISSPSLFYDDEILFRDFDAFARRKISKPLYVFTDHGGDELPGMGNSLRRFGEKLVEAHPAEIILETLIVPDTDHTTVVPSVLAPALDHLYNYRPTVTPTTADLSRFSGQYRLPDGTVMTFVTDGSQLLFRDSTVDYETGSLVHMLASAPNRFFRRGSSQEIEFPAAPGPVASARVVDVRTGAVIEALWLETGEYRQTEVKVRTGHP